jgi:hypothetical protein
MSEMLATVDEDVFHMQQAAFLLGQVAFDQSPFVFTEPRDERLEFMRLETAEGASAVVLRQRHDSVIDGHREDVYFGFRVEQNDPNEALSVLVDDLRIEQEWIRDSEFDKIKPRHDALAKKVINSASLNHEVKAASHDNIREFLRLLHETVSQQKELRAAS